MELIIFIGVMCFKDKGCGSNFIMTSATNSSNLPRPEFSRCSLTDIWANLGLVTGDPSFNCLQEDDMGPLVVSVSRGPSWNPHPPCVAVMFLVKSLMNIILIL